MRWTVGISSSKQASRAIRSMEYEGLAGSIWTSGLCVCGARVEFSILLLPHEPSSILPLQGNGSGPAPNPALLWLLHRTGRDPALRESRLDLGMAVTDPGSTAGAGREQPQASWLWLERVGRGGFVRGMCNVCVAGQGFRGVVVGRCCHRCWRARGRRDEQDAGWGESSRPTRGGLPGRCILLASLRKIAKLETHWRQRACRPHARLLRVYSVVHVPLGLWPVDGWMDGWNGWMGRGCGQKSFGRASRTGQDSFEWV